MNHRSLKVGRSSDNDIILTHPTVSSHHLDVFIDEMGVVFITDKNSTNGTFVNGMRITGTYIMQKGDILKLAGDNPLRWENWIPASTRQSQYAAQQLQHANQSNNTLTILYSSLIGVLLLLIIFITYKLTNGGNGESPKTQTANVSPGNETPSNPQQSSPLPPANTRPDSVPTAPVQKPDGTVYRPPVPKPRTNIHYSYDCLETDDDPGIMGTVDEYSDEMDSLTGVYGGKVPLREEIQYGNDAHEKIMEEYTLITQGQEYGVLQKILRRLVQQIPNPRGFTYKIFLIETEMLNAFTVGGRIYVTQEMYSFCDNEDELAAIIGHEIYHNELGHIKQMIQLSKIPGADLLSLIAVPFNQKKETSCDLYGMDLAKAAGYYPCACVEVWQRMKENYPNDSDNPLDNLFMDHPYNSSREKCARNHLMENYRIQCD